MFSGIGQILNVPRLAEHADTRQELQHHDPEYQRRKRDSSKNHSEGAQDEDTTVSVEALSIFLQNFLKTTGNQRKRETKTFNGEDRRQSDEQLTPPPETQREMNLGEDTRKRSAQAARAAYAYQTMAHSNKKERILLETTDQGDGPEFELNASDVRTIHLLLEDLRTLKDRNIEYLIIGKADTFLQSLVTSVQAALTASKNH
jgi:hypothetical protein